MSKQSKIGGIWSAAPTPYANDGSLDGASIDRLMEHHLKLGVSGVFIGGTSGEGPWLPQSMLGELARRTVRAAAGRMPVAVQVTDNSAQRMIDNIAHVADSGVDIVVIAPPFFQLNASQDYLKKLYMEVIDNSPLPVCLYHRGKYASVLLAGDTAAQIATHEKVIMVKDSSQDPEAKAAFLRLKRGPRRGLALMGGDEFDCVSALRDGYDGLLLGGACFNGGMARRLYELFHAGKIEEAQEVQKRMNHLMGEVFGGKDFKCWLAGQKRMLVELGVFATCRTIINYDVTAECEKAIKAAARQYKAELLPCQRGAAAPELEGLACAAAV